MRICPGQRFLDIENEEWLCPNSYDIPHFWIWTMTNGCAQIRMTYTDFRHAIVAIKTVSKLMADSFVSKMTAIKIYKHVFL